MATLAVTARADLTDAQWAVLEPLLPRGKQRPPAEVGEAAAHQRDPVAGPGRRAVAGRAAQYGPWQTVYGLFRRWQRDGTWRRVLTGLQARADAAGLITWDVSVDSTVARAHQHAAGARKRGICRPSRPAACATSPPITRWAAPAAG